MKPEKEITDEQLDQWLRDVLIPTQLHAELLQITRQTDLNLLAEAGETTPLHEQVTTGETRLPHSRLVGLTWLTIAASVLLATIIAINNVPNQEAQQQAATPNTDHSKTDRPTYSLVIESMAPADLADDATTTPELQAVQAQLVEMESMMQQMEIHRLQTQVNQLGDQSSSQLSSNEVNSMIIALAEQSAISFGGSTERVSEKMNQIIAQFPNSRGARIAEDFLTQYPTN